VAEWSKANDSKSFEGKPSVGSNPTLSVSGLKTGIPDGSRDVPLILKTHCTAVGFCCFGVPWHPSKTQASRQPLWCRPEGGHSVAAPPCSHPPVPDGSQGGGDVVACNQKGSILDTPPVRSPSRTCRMRSMPGSALPPNGIAAASTMRRSSAWRRDWKLRFPPLMGSWRESVRCATASDPTVSILMRLTPSSGPVGLDCRRHQRMNRKNPKN
jgi:hypothetical protein